jgi:RHS repeat-associated protein
MRSNHAQGNVLGVYTRTTAATPTITWSEQYLYGSGRLGSVQPSVSWTAASTYTGPHYMGTKRLLSGQKRYEIANHLGNVLTTIGDRKIPVDGAVADNTAEYYTAVVHSAQDYYPFGMEMPGRTFVLGGGYRYGFGGQEKDQEVYGSTSLYYAAFWEYDARIGRRWNVDPITKPWESPFASFKNNPLFFADPDGKDGIATIKISDPLTKGKKIYEGGSKQNPNHITVKANYYYNSNTLHKVDGAEEALKASIEEYNNSDFTVMGEDGKYYKVKFELSAIAVEQSDLQDIRVEHAMKDNAGDDTDEGYAPYGSIVDVDVPGMNDMDPSELGSANTNTISIRSAGVADAIKAGADKKITLKNLLKHEIGHNLGGAHEDSGVLDKSEWATEKSQIITGNGPSTRILTYPNKLTKGNVEALIKTIWAGGKQGERPGRIKEVKEKRP